MRRYDKQKAFIIGDIQNIVPSLLNPDATKVISQLKVDEQRNILYCLKEEQEGRCKGHSEISVFDLGMLGD